MVVRRNQRRPRLRAAARGGGGDRIVDAAILDRFAPYLLNQITSRINEEMRRALAPLGMSVAQWRVLLGLMIENGRSIGDLALFTVMGQPTVSRVVDQMEADGLVRRRRMSDNRRVTRVLLTPAGIARFRAVWPIAERINGRTTAPLAPTKAAAFLAGLARVLEGLGGRPAAGPGRRS